MSTCLCPFATSLLYSGTTTVTSSVADSNRSLQGREHIQANECVTENEFHQILRSILLHLMDTLHGLSDGGVTCLNRFHELQVILLAAPHESDWHFQTISHVCLILLAKPDGWSSTRATNTRRFQYSLDLYLQLYIKIHVRATDYVLVNSGNSWKRVRWESPSLNCLLSKFNDGILYLKTEFGTAFMHVPLIHNNTDCRVQPNTWDIITTSSLNCLW